MFNYIHTFCKENLLNLLLDFSPLGFFFCVLSGTAEIGGESSNFGTHRGCLTASLVHLHRYRCFFFRRLWDVFGFGIGEIKQNIAPFLEKGTKILAVNDSCFGWGARGGVVLFLKFVGSEFAGESTRISHLWTPHPMNSFFQDFLLVTQSDAINHPWQETLHMQLCITLQGTSPSISHLLRRSENRFIDSPKNPERESR